MSRNALESNPDSTGWETLYYRLVKNSEAFPDKELIICGNSVITYRGFLFQVRAIAEQLLKDGVHKGDRVVVESSRKVDFLAGVTSCIAIGAVAVPLPTDKSEEIKAIVADCEPRAFIGRPELTERVRIDCQGMPVEVFVDQTEVVSTGRVFHDFTRFEAEDSAILFYTSGTTSGSKTGVLISHGNLFDTVSYMNEYMRLETDVVEYCVAPIHHAFGFGRFRAVLQVGGTIVLDDGHFHPAKALVAIEKNECNSISSVSTGFVLLLEHFEKEFKKIGQEIRWVEIGSLPMDVRYKRRLVAVLPGTRIVMNYGLTEAMRATMIDLNSEQDKLHSVGRQSPGVHVQIHDEGGSLLPIGSVGEIVVSGVNVAKGLWKKEDLWRKRFDSGFLRTGDLGRIDEEGYLYFIGRKDDVINVGGKKFSPIEVEDRLVPIMDGAAFCICGIPDPNKVLGEIPVLCVEGEQSPPFESVQSCFSGSVESYKTPVKIVLLDSLPRTQNGKIMRNRVKEMLSVRDAKEIA